MKILVINGPNLNLLGIREPGVYGSQSFEQLCNMVREEAEKLGVEVTLFQSNSEGALIDVIQQAYGDQDGIVINPGAYTHYSYAIHDALKAVEIPAVEVHISDIYAREAFRAISVVRPACVLQISGHGLEGYLEAMRYLVTSVV